MQVRETVSDRELVEQTIAGDQSAFSVLYDKYAPLVRAICFAATGELNSAQDLAQEVFIRAYTRLSTVEDAGKFGAWVAGIARLSGKEWRRKQGRDRLEFKEEMTNAFAADSESDERLAVIHEAMSDLDEHERFALDAYYLQEQSVKSAREILQMSQSGFYKLLERSKKKLGRAINTRHQGL